jgi:nitrite reductase/ring-hydroxylating ferredoxin subunit
VRGETATWTWVASLAEFDERAVIGVECDGRRLALYRLSDGVFASTDTCPHHGSPLSHGCVVDGFIECPVHYALFDIRTGAPDGAVTTRRLKTMATKVEDGDIYVDVSGLEETVYEG